MGVYKTTALSKLAIAVMLNVTVAAPSYAYTLNHQPMYVTGGQESSQGRAPQARQQVRDNQDFEAQVETRNQAAPAQVATTDSGLAAGSSAAAAAAMLTEDEESFAPAPNNAASAAANAAGAAGAVTGTGAAAAMALMEDEDSGAAPAPAQTQSVAPSVPSYARAPEPRAPEPRQATRPATSGAGYVIPRPNYNVNYASKDVRTHMQGNAYLSVDNTKSEMDQQAAEYDQSVISNLQARNFDPSQLTLDALKDQRLSSYDKDMWKEDQARRSANPFGDMFALEDLYNTIPRGSTAYYVRNDLDGKKFLNIMTHSLDRYLKDYEIGFVLLDDRGLVALYNNNDFPLEGIANFQLAYIAGVAMNRLGDNLDMHVRYVATDLNRNVYSPFATSVLQDVQSRIRKYEDLQQAKAEALARGEEWPPEPVETEEEDEDGEGPKGPPPIVIAKVLQPAGRTEGFDTLVEKQERKDSTYRSVNASNYVDPSQNILVSDRITKTKADLIGEWDKSEACNKDRFSAKLNAYTSTQLKSLFYYGLNFNDPNAADLLMAYIGSATAMNFELKSKGINHTRYNIQMSDVKQSPELNYHNASPLFDMAKLYAMYVKDKQFPIAVSNEIDAALDNTVNVKRGIYRGITNSIRKDSDEDYATLTIRSISGLSGFGLYSPKGVTTELAFIEYKGERYIMAVGIKNIPARNANEFKSNSEKYVSFVTTHMFNLMREAFPYLRSNPVITDNNSGRRAY